MLSSRLLLWCVPQQPSIPISSDPSIQTPMGALSVVISAILSSIFLNEKLTFFGWLGCSLCIVCPFLLCFLSHLTPSRSVLSSSHSTACPSHSCLSVPNPLQGPQEQTPSEISQFKTMFLAPGFLAYIGVLITIALSIIIYFGPKSVFSPAPSLNSYVTRHGKNNMIWYITVCSTIGGISVSVTTGLGAAIVTSVMGYNQVRTFRLSIIIFPSSRAQFNNWFIFFLMGFVVVTLCRCLPVSPKRSNLMLRSDRSVLFERRACAIQYRCAFHIHLAAYTLIHNVVYTAMGTFDLFGARS